MCQSARYESLLNDLRNVETKLAEELTRFSPDSLSIRVLEEQRDNIVPLLEQEAERVIDTENSLAITNYQSVELQRKVLREAEEKAASEMNQLPELIMEYTDLQRELEIAAETLTRFLTTRETLRIEAAQTEIPWQLIETPTVSMYPVSPNTTRNLLIGAVAGIFLGLIAALVTEKLDNVYHSVDEIKAAQSLPVLGKLPFSPAFADQLKPKKSMFKRLRQNISHVSFRSRSEEKDFGDISKNIYLESIRVLYSNIKMLSPDKPLRSIVISSASPGDGKSTVAINLAQVASAMGQHVLIVDADLRRPQIHGRMRLSNELGLSDLLTEDASLKLVVQQVNSEKQIWAVTAGSTAPDPTKLLSSEKMKKVMRSFHNSFDLVIYDSPPVLGLADVNFISRQSDGVALVTRIGETRKEMLTQAVETLELAKTPALGIISNAVPVDKHSNYYQYYTYSIKK